MSPRTGPDDDIGINGSPQDKNDSPCFRLGNGKDGDIRPAPSRGYHLNEDGKRFCAWEHLTRPPFDFASYVTVIRPASPAFNA
jgi:hypothetical protein